MIVDEKTAPPPPYIAPQPSTVYDGDNVYASYIARRFTHTLTKYKPNLSSLPSHLLLQIVYSTFPQQDGQFEGDTKVVRQRENLHWLIRNLRLVSRKLYIACMHILRSTYLPTYDSLVRAPYSSDPFPSSEAFAATAEPASRNPYHKSQPSNLFPMHRELATLDKFIAVLAHEDVLLDSTSLHLTRHEAYKDIFDLLQPKSRLEDLVAVEGVRWGVVTLGDKSSGSTSTSTPPTPSTPVSEYNDLPAEKVKNNEYAMDPTQLPSPGFSPPPSPSPPYGSPSASTISLSRSQSPPLSRSQTQLSQSGFKKSKSALRIFSFYRGKGKGKGKAKAEYSPNTISPFPLPPSFESQTPRKHITPIPFANLTVSFSPRKVGLMYTPHPTRTSNSSLTVTGTSSSLTYGFDAHSRNGYGGSSYGSLSVSHGAMIGRKRTLVELDRSREDTLDVCARRLARALRDWMDEGGEI